MTEFKINRGLSSNLPSKLTDGWVYFCTDTGEIYTDCIDNGVLRRKKIKSLDALQRSGGTMEGALKFTPETHFGTATPTIAEEGQVFFLNSGNGIEDENALKKGGDTMEGVLRFTEGIHFGDAEPEIGDEGQIYFIEGEVGGEAVKPFAVIGVEYPVGSVCTCISSDGATVLTADDDGEEYMFLIPSAGMWTVSCTDGEHSSSEDVSIVDKCQIETVVLEYMLASSILEDNSWAVISNIAASGQAQNYWSVGDCKAVDIKGTVGTLALDTTLYVYIIGFDHNGATNTIDFGTFKTALSGGTDVCLIDSKYDSDSTDGTKYFNMNRNSSADNAGGWKGCDLRYDVLGSTNTSGGDAGATTATSPVSGTLMAALPVELRAVMKPMTVYTDNTGNGTKAASNVTSSVDYLPLLAEFEIFGAQTYANSAEKNYQVQYAYYSAGNSKVKYRHSATGSTAEWWERSPDYTSHGVFCAVSTTGGADCSYSRFIRGLAPVFRV